MTEVGVAEAEEIPDFSSLDTLLSQMNQGDVPPDILYESRGRTRVRPIDEALDAMSQHLDAGAPEPVFEITSDKKLITGYEAYIDALNNASRIISTLKRGKAGDTKFKGPWPQHRYPVPHEVIIERLRQVIDDRTSPVQRRYKHWLKKNREKINEIYSPLEEVGRAANETGSLYSRLEEAYDALHNGLTEFKSGWLDMAANILGSEKEVYFILRTLEGTERRARENAEGAQEKFANVKATIVTEVIKHQEGTSYALTEEDIGKKARKRGDGVIPGYGLLGMFSEIEAKINGVAGYIEGKTLFWDGITPHTEEKASLLKALSAIRGLDIRISEITDYKNSLEEIRTNLIGGDFSVTYEPEYSLSVVNAKVQESEMLLQSLKGYKNAHSYYKEKIEDVSDIREIAEPIREAYHSACERVREYVTAFYTPNIFDSINELINTKNWVGIVVENAQTLMNFNIPGITNEPERAVTQEELDGLEDFIDLLGYIKREYDNFCGEMKEAKTYHTESLNYSFERAVEGARDALDEIDELLENPIMIGGGGTGEEPRSPVHQISVEITFIDESMRTQLSIYKREIDEGRSGIGRYSIFG